MDKIQVFYNTEDMKSFRDLFDEDLTNNENIIREDKHKMKEMEEFLTNLSKSKKRIYISEYIDIIYDFSSGDGKGTSITIKDLVWSTDFDNISTAIVDYLKELKLTGKIHTIISGEYTCPRSGCGNMDDISIMPLQDRSRDESTSVYAECPKCDKKFRLE
jgi:DNA-directed RNA polymerase subunit M/transcription elongation factor TFIIS